MKLLLIIIISIIYVQLQADELLVGNKYRMLVDMNVSTYKTKDMPSVLQVGALSKFIVMDSNDSEKYAIRFTNIYKYSKIKNCKKIIQDYKKTLASILKDCNKKNCNIEAITHQQALDKVAGKTNNDNKKLPTCESKDCTITIENYKNTLDYETGDCDITAGNYKNTFVSDVIENKPYYLNKYNFDGVSIDSITEESIGGLTTGPLVVPFKYRLNDKSLESSTTIGAYVGYGFDIFKKLTLAPFISGGIAQISIAEEDPNGNQSTKMISGFTFAGGLLLTNVDNINIGIVLGKDWIGSNNLVNGKEWEYEGKTWLSFSIGLDWSSN